jgi:membrane associated rhomboid family serine protease
MGKIKIDILFFLIVICVACFLFDTLYDVNIMFGINKLFYLYSFYFQPLTAIFFHNGIIHLAMNMIVLFQFWRYIQNYLNQKLILFIFIVGGVFTSFVSLLYTFMFDNNSTTLGASGAICVLIGVFAYIDVARRNGLALFILFISFAPLVFGFNIAWYAHISGFIFGFIFMKLRLFRYVHI